jgi:hypothetical protein
VIDLFSPKAAAIDRQIMEGSAEAFASPPANGLTVEALLLHPRKFGVDQVWETALMFLAELMGIADVHRKKPKRDSRACRSRSGSPGFRPRTRHRLHPVRSH